MNPFAISSHTVRVCIRLTHHANLPEPGTAVHFAVLVAVPLAPLLEPLDPTGQDLLDTAFGEKVKRLVKILRR